MTRRILIVFLFAAVACSAAGPAVSSKGEIMLIGSTPGGTEIKKTLGIDAERKVDFIRWELRLDDGTRKFTGQVTFGESEPNTNGFIGGGETRKFAGRYTTVGERIKLSTAEIPEAIVLADIDGRIFHLVGPDNKLMVGNGGWGYSLARQDREPGKARPLVTLSKALLDETEPETIFDGRTPCVDLGRSDLPFTEGCLKLKWRLRLLRDSGPRTAGTYRLESTLNRREIVEGKWTLVNGTHANPAALFLKLDMDHPAGAISFFVADSNVIFMTDRDERLRAGNGDFGFTLNRVDRSMMTRAKP